MQQIKETINDIAGIRITCSFVSDIYKLEEMLRKQTDMQVLSVKDYIKKPKDNATVATYDYPCPRLYIFKARSYLC